MVAATLDKPQTVPYTMNLPDGQTVFVRIPSEMVEYDRSGEMMFTPAGGRHLDRIRALAMKTPRHPSPSYLKTVREALGLTQAKFAQRVQRSTITIKKWESGTLRPGQDAVAKIRQVVDRAARRGISITP